MAFRDVGTALKVRASLLPGDRIRVRLTPTISYFSADGSGTIEFTEASTDVIVPNDRAVLLAGSTTETFRRGRLTGAPPARRPPPMPPPGPDCAGTAGARTVQHTVAIRRDALNGARAGRAV